MNKRQSVTFLCIALIIAAVSVYFAGAVESSFGDLDVSYITIPNSYGQIQRAKLFVPKGVTSDHPAPAVLAMHGYQNDKDTNSAYAIELARNGYVVLSLDLYGHGDTTIPLRERRVELPPNGVRRFKLMTTFQYFGDEVEGLKETTLGGSNAFNYLQDLPITNPDEIIISGHSLGTWSGYATALENPDHAAMIMQCGEPEGPFRDSKGDLIYKNVLLIQAQYDEFGFFRDGELTVPDLKNSPTRWKFFAGLSRGPMEWGESYGSFSDGTARRMILYPVTHRIITHHRASVREAVAWAHASIGREEAVKSTIFMGKELLMLAAMLSMLLSLLPLSALLIKIPFFSTIKSPMPDRYTCNRKKWAKQSGIAVLVSGLSYPFLTQLGHGLFPLPEKITRILMANGVAVWFGFLMIVNFFLFRHWYLKGEGKDLTMYDMGVSWERNATVIRWGEIFRTVLLGAVLFLWLYGAVSIARALYGVEFRFIWPFFRPMNTMRLGQFFLYIPIYLLFFLFNGGIKLFGQLRLPESGGAVKTQIVWWLKSVYVMLGGLFLVILIEYLPFVLGIGPGFDAMGLGLFGGPFMSALMLIVPQFFIFFFLTVYFFRQTGKIYLGSLMTALLAVWVVTGGSAFY